MLCKESIMSNSRNISKKIGDVFGLQPSVRDADVYISAVTNGRSVLGSVRARCKYRIGQGELAYSKRNKKSTAALLANA